MKIDKFFHLYETENDVIFEDVTGHVYDEEWRKMHYKSSYNQGFLEGAKLCEQAQPEIIRCRDCRYYEWMSNRVPDEQTWFCHRLEKTIIAHTQKGWKDEI